MDELAGSQRETNEGNGYDGCLTQQGPLYMLLCSLSTA